MAVFSPETAAPVRWAWMLIGIVASTNIACTTLVPARFAKEPTELLDRPASLFVIAVYQRDRIVTALHAADLDTVEDPAEASRELEVKIGAGLEGAPCGLLNNVRFQLRVKGTLIAELTARGWTGDCTPNALDDLSRLLATSFGDDGAQP